MRLAVQNVSTAVRRFVCFEGRNPEGDSYPPNQLWLGFRLGGFVAPNV
jgi:hypothetical protein